MPALLIYDQLGIFLGSLSLLVTLVADCQPGFPGVVFVVLTALHAFNISGWYTDF